MPFSPEVAENVLVKSARYCCLCRRYKGTKIEVHHIIQGADQGGNEASNAIPLCFDCHADVGSYNDHHPKGRKFRPSELIKHRDAWFALVASGQAGPNNPWPKEDPDVKLIRFFRGCLNRPAFQDAYLREGSYGDFDKAVEDTITALNAGALKDRSGTVLAKSKGTSHLRNPSWLTRMEDIVQLLRAIRSRFKIVEREQRHQDTEVGQWMDQTRHQVIEAFNAICNEAKLPPLPHSHH